MKLKTLSLLAMSGVCGFTMVAWAANTSTPGTYLVETKCPEGSYCPGDGQKYTCPANSNCGASSTEITCTTGYTLTNGKCVATQTCPTGTMKACPEKSVISNVQTLNDGTKCYVCSCEGKFELVNGQCTCPKADEWKKQLQKDYTLIKSSYSKAEALCKKLESTQKGISNGQYLPYMTSIALCAVCKNTLQNAVETYELELKNIMQDCYYLQDMSYLMSQMSAHLMNIQSIYSDNQLKKVICNADYYASGLKCLACPTGTTTNGKTGAQSKSECVAVTTCTKAGWYADATTGTCKECPAGTYSAAGATECTKCPAGTYTSSKVAAKCTTCATNYVSAKGAAKCTKCTNGPANKDHTTCEPCAAGTYFNGTKCLACSGNTYATAGMTKCTKCTNGLANETRTACEPCKDGTYFRTTTCVKCPSNATCKGGVFTCNTGYKKSGYACVKDWRKT